MTVTLADFLLARIAEDEALMHEAIQWKWAWRTPSGVVVADRSTFPARVLAECEAKRRIVGEHETMAAAYPGTTIETDPCCATCSAGGEYPGEFPCPTLRFLALPYADHPDYQQEWRP